jgi:tetratricopeptide (TPR) repeat protein
VYLSLGEPEKAAEYGRYGAQRATEADGLDCAAFGHSVHGMGLLESGRLGDAIQAFDRALERVRTTGHMTFVNRLHGLIGTARLRQGDQAARAGLLQALEDGRRAGDEHFVADLASRLAEIDLEAGRLASAGALLDEAIAYFRRTSMRPALVRALGALARVREAEEGAGAAVALREEASRLATEMSA